jgi:uncharacterized protein (DUF2336 family)
MTEQPSPGLDISVFEKVLEQGSPEDRKRLAIELATLTAAEETPESERAAVVPVLLKLAVDAVKEVRRAMAAGLTASRRLHPDLLFTMVADEDEIALPFLENCPALDSCRMLAILRVGDGPRQTAIARRGDVTHEVTKDICEHREQVACVALLDNRSATLKAAEYQALYRRFGQDGEIVERLIARDDLPLDIRVLQAKRASNRMHQLMAEKGWIAANDASELVADAEETAILRILLEASPEECHRVIAFLVAKKLLTPSIIVRAACLGEMSVVERALAHLANVPPGRARHMLYSDALRTLHAKSGLPQSCLPILRAAADVAREMQADGLRLNADGFGRRLIEMLMTHYEGMRVSDRAKALEFVARFAQDRVRVIAKRLKADLMRAA